MTTDNQKKGWLALWRGVTESWVFKNEKVFKVWIYCLTRSVHKKQIVKMQIGSKEYPVTLNPGQFIFGRNSWSEALNMPPSTVRWCVEKLCQRYAIINISEGKKLKDLSKSMTASLTGNIDSRKYTIYQVKNWKKYQQFEQHVLPESEHVDTLTHNNNDILLPTSEGEVSSFETPPPPRNKKGVGKDVKKDTIDLWDEEVILEW